MAIPTDSPGFATDATFAADGDTWSGAPTKADPGAGRKAEGYEPDTLPAEWLNWQLNLIGKWLVALLGLSARCTVVDRGTWTFNNPTAAGFGYTSTANAAFLWFEAPALPDGVLLTGAAVYVDPGAARGAGSRMEVKVYIAPSGTSGIPAEVGSQEDSGAGTAQTVTAAVASSPLVAGDRVLVRVESGTDGAHVPDVCYSVVVTYTEP